MGRPEDDSSPPAPLTLSGRTVAGRYQVIELLGQGGIGRVYSAVQVGLDRRCAVKVIRPERRDDPVTVQRFMREARAAGRISSPHVVTLFDFGKDGSELYIAMELLEGQSLAERVRDNEPMSLGEAVSTAGSIAQGLRAAHEAGVLHRDLKPANVFLCSDGVVKVLDFGIAKLMDDSNDWEPLTAVNRILGTPVYMSPEAATRRPLGPTADLYALGLLIYEMCVGEPPFKTGNAMKTLKAQVSDPAPRLKHAAPWLPIPDALDELVHELLQKDPADRPRDAGAVVERLDEIGARLRSGSSASSPRGEPTKIDLETPGLRSGASGRYEIDSEETEIWRGRPWEDDPSVPPSIPSMHLDTGSMDGPAPPRGAGDPTPPAAANPNAPTAPAPMGPEGMAPGAMAPGAMAPGAMAPGTLAPGTLAPGTMAPGPTAPSPADPSPTRRGIARLSPVQMVVATVGAGFFAFALMIVLRLLFG